MLEKKIKLNSGYEIPVIGLGTGMVTDEHKIKESIRNAIKVGYRHIDTAFMYQNEKYIGEVLQELFAEKTIKREDIFITSKLFSTYHEDVELGIRTTLKDLQLEYVDLYLVHIPATCKHDSDFKPIKDENGKFLLEEFDCVGLWKKMEQLVEKGLAKSIGVANYGVFNLGKLLKDYKIKPAVNQFEMHPYLTQEELVDFCHKNDITVISYSSLGGSIPNENNIKEDPEILEIAKKYNKTVPQVILSWLISKNVLVIPKSSKLKHLKENSELFDLKEEDLKTISGLNRNVKFIDASLFGSDRFK